MSRIAKKFIRFGTGTKDVNAQAIPATNTPTNYTPVQVASEGTDKVSAHLNGINTALAGIDVVPGDINQTTWSGLANNTANQDITGLTFAGTVSSFTAQVSFRVDATTDYFVQYTIDGIQRGADWVITTDATGDAIPGISFGITTGGQVQVTIGNLAGFVSGSVKFRARVITV